MAQKLQAQSVYNLTKFLKKENLLPVYFFFGEDTFSIEQAVKAVEKSASGLIANDFDREVINTKDRTVVELMDIASAFPFGSDRKIIIAKEFDELKGDKKSFASYANNPSPTTILVTTKLGKIANLDSEPYKTLVQKNYIFEAKELKGKELVNWIQRFTAMKGKTIQIENAELLADIVGDNRSMIEMQLQKIFSYIGEENEVSYEIILNISSNLKEYNIFDLINALGLRNKTESFKILYNILDKRKEDPQKNALFIITMLNRYFTGLGRIPEMEKENIPDKDKSKFAGTHPFYYPNYVKAARYYRDEKLLYIFRSLFNADLCLKTTSADVKTVLTILITEIFSA